MWVKLTANNFGVLVLWTISALHTTASWPFTLSFLAIFSNNRTLFFYGVFSINAWFTRFRLG